MWLFLSWSSGIKIRKEFSLCPPPPWALLPLRPQQWIIWAPCLMQSRGRLAEVAVSTGLETVHTGKRQTSTSPSLLLLCSSFTSHFSDEHPVICFTSSVVSLCLILLSCFSFSVYGLFSFAGIICYMGHWGQWGYIFSIHLFIFFSFSVSALGEFCQDLETTLELHAGNRRHN